MPAVPARRPAVVGRLLSEVLCAAHHSGTARAGRAAAQGASQLANPESGGRSLYAAAARGEPQRLPRPPALNTASASTAPAQPDRGMGAGKADREAAEKGKRPWHTAALPSNTAGAHKVGRRITFELSRPRRRAGLAVRPMMNQGGCAAKPACRSGSALERGVRLHCGAHRWREWDQTPTPGE
jgi:hypothetical protein